MKEINRKAKDGAEDADDQTADSGAGENISARLGKEDYSPPIIRPQLSVGLVRLVQNRLWMVTDVIFGVVSMFFGYLLSPQFHWGSERFSASYVLLTIITFGVSVIISGFITGLYDKSSSISQFRLIMMSIVTCLSAVILTSLLFALLLFQPIGRWVLAISLITSILFLSIPRVIVFRSSQSNKIKIMIISEIDEVIKIYKAIEKYSINFPFEVAGICIVEHTVETSSYKHLPPDKKAANIELDQGWRRRIIEATKLCEIS